MNELSKILEDVALFGLTLTITPVIPYVDITLSKGELSTTSRMPIDHHLDRLPDIIKFEKGRLLTKINKES